MFRYSTNNLFNLTDEQRKVLMQCLVIGVRPPDLLLQTRYAILEPTGEIGLTAEAAQDYTVLVQQGLKIDEITGEIVEQPTIPAKKRLEPASRPFSLEQEQFLRQFIADILRRASEDLLDD